MAEKLFPRELFSYDEVMRDVDLQLFWIVAFLGIVALGIAIKVWIY